MNDHLERLKVVGLGNPMLDISATVDTSFLKKHGLNANTAKHIENEKLFDEIGLSRWSIIGSKVTDPRSLPVLVGHSRSLAWTRS